MQLLCVGDIAILDEYVARQAWDPPGGIVPSDEARVLFNWEFPIGKAINPQPRSSGPRHMAHPNAVHALRKWSPGFAALANNHLLDAGEDGLVDTIQGLRRAGFVTMGAGQTAEEISQPMFWETPEGRLAIVNWVFPETHPEWMCVPGPNCWPGIDKAARTIRDLKRQADWVLVRAHWSDEDFTYPRPKDRAIARELAGAGADLIVGDHPHVVRGMETVDACQVVYSVGNYFFSYERTDYGSWNMRAPRNREGLGIQISFRHGERPECRPLSFWKLKKRVVPDPIRRAATRLKRVSRPLRRFEDAEYAEWYAKKRAAFNRWGYRWHFRAWNLGVSDVRRILSRAFRGRARVT
jgi:hypothetical protein